MPRRSSRLSANQVQVVTLPEVQRILRTAHALDQPANFVFTKCLSIFRWKTDVNESLSVP